MIEIKVHEKARSLDLSTHRCDKNVFIYVYEVDEYNSMYNVLFQEAAVEMPFITVFEKELKKRWQQLLVSEKGRLLTRGKLSWLLKGEYNWEKEVSRAAKKYLNVYVVFLNCSFKYHKPPSELLLYYKRKYSNVYYILFYIDMVTRFASKYSNYLRKKNVFDLVYSFDSVEAKSNGFIFWNTPYSELSNITRQEEPSYDIYFCANVKERKKDIEAIIVASKSTSVNIKMDLVLDDSEDHSFEKYRGIVSTYIMKNLPYPDVVERSLKSNCILEICLPGQKGLSLRAYEAVVYNKKLLTNNKYITTFPFYNSQFMHYYSNVDDIDWRWVKEKTFVDYGYNGGKW